MLSDWLTYFCRGDLRSRHLDNTTAQTLSIEVAVPHLEYVRRKATRDRRVLTKQFLNRYQTTGQLRTAVHVIAMGEPRREVNLT